MNYALCTLLLHTRPTTTAAAARKSITQVEATNMSATLSHHPSSYGRPLMMRGADEPKRNVTTSNTTVTAATQMLVSRCSLLLVFFSLAERIAERTTDHRHTPKATATTTSSTMITILLNIAVPMIFISQFYTTNYSNFTNPPLTSHFSPLIFIIASISVIADSSICAVRCSIFETM